MAFCCGWGVLLLLLILTNNGILDCWVKEDVGGNVRNLFQGLLVTVMLIEAGEVASCECVAFIEGSSCKVLPVGKLEVAPDESTRQAITHHLISPHCD
jgi:hypothetical protein